MPTRSTLIALVVIASGSASGIAVRALGYPAAVPQVAAHLLDWFVEPGLSVWWFTLGGAFQAFPSNTQGYVVAAVANTVFWLLVTSFVVGVTRRARHRAV